MTCSSNECLIAEVHPVIALGGEEGRHVSEISAKERIDKSRAGEMAQWVRALAANPNNLRLISQNLHSRR